MKVIKQPPAFQPLKISCKHCTAELEADEKDFKRDTYAGDQREPGSSYDYAVAECPICRTAIIVSKELFPKYIYDRLPPRYQRSFQGRD